MRFLYLDTDEIAINAETGEKECKKVGKIIHADTEIIWDNELDTFGSENYPKYVPHPYLIEYLSLRHHDNDNAYYDSNGNQCNKERSSRFLS